MEDREHTEARDPRPDPPGHERAAAADQDEVDGSFDLYNGDLEHAGFDNLAFFGENQLGVVEDAGDTLHAQRNGLDSLWMFDANAGLGSATPPAPVRVLAEGRDPSATTDSAIGALPSASASRGASRTTATTRSRASTSRTAIRRSRPASSASGLAPPVPRRRWRVFWTQQHGDNNTFELILSNADRAAGYDRD